MARWTYATTLPQGSEWHVSPTSFDSLEEAAEAIKRWLVMAAEHNHFVTARLEKLDELKMA